MIDIHSHILPGIDDGAETLENSVAMVRELAEHGVTDVIATPHYVDETIYTSPAGDNLQLMEELKVALANEGVEMEVHLGNEIYINERVAELIETGKMSTLAGGEYLLVELPMSGEYPGHTDVILDLMENGYKVILAHPERYAAVQDDLAVVTELYNAGVLLQCNLGSVIGQYGKHAKKTVRELAKRKMIFAFGSDIHHCRGEDYWMEVQKKLRKIYSADELEQVLVKNPQKILA